MFSFHRSILRQAWQTTWKHKRLWLLGILAGLVNTGGVLNITFRTFHRLSPELTWRSYLEGSMPGATTILLYVQKLALVSQTRLGLTVAVILIALIALAVLALCAQAGLIKAIPLVDRGRKLGHFTNHSLTTLGQLLGLDFLARLAMLLLTFGTGLAIVKLVSHTVTGNALITFGLLLIFIPISLLIGYLSVFAAIEVVIKGQGIIHAVQNTWRVLTKHWLPIAELTVLLFFVNLLASFTAIVAVVLFAVPYLVSLKTATVVGSGFLWLGTMAFGAVFIILIGLLIFGWMTASTYAAWYHAYEKLGNRPSVTSKLERVFQHFL